MTHDPQRLLYDRYRQEASTSDLPWNNVLSTLLSHRSVRRYRDTPLPAGTLETLIAAAQSASTSSNLQPWSVVAVEDPARKARLAELSGGQKHIIEAPLFLVWLADLSRIRRIAERQDSDPAGVEALEHLLLAVADTSLAAQNAFIALESLDLGGVYIGGIRNHPEQVAAELNLPPHVLAVVGLCVGWPDPETATGVKPRLPQEAVLHRETYQPETETAAIAAYDTRLRGFQQEQGMPLIDWSAQTATRINRLGSRARMAEAVRALGFPLR